MRRLPLVLLFLALLAAHAAARAGGGQNYHGSSSYGSSSYSYGGGSSSGSSGGGIDGFFLYLLLELVFSHPIIGIPLVLFLLYMVSIMKDAERVLPLDGGATPEGPQISSRMGEELARLRQRDPAFDQREFLGRAGAAFLKIQEAWSAGSMATARGFISDGVDERFTRQLAALKAKGLRNAVTDVEIRETELMACRSDRHFDTLWVRVSASATDRMLDEHGVEVSSDGRQDFEEVWTFLRRPGARTLKRQGGIEGGCPSCGAPLPIVDAAQCEACKTWVASGDYDWVLAEITQSCEWVLREPMRDIDGWAAAATDDPALSLPALEDRASVIFWRWADSLRLGDPSPLKPVASAEFVARGAAFTAPFENTAVGAVEVMAFEDAGEWRRVHVGVKWSGGGELRRDFFVLKRARAAKTDEKQGLRTARCPSCGAPPAARSEEACAYCGKPLNDGRKDWVLDAVVPFGEWRRPSGAVAARPGAQPATLAWGSGLSAADAYAALAVAMLADGEESLAERAFLDSYAQSRGIPAAKAEEICAAARAGRLDVPEPSNPSQAEELLRGMVRMSLADAVVTEAERVALDSFALKHGVGMYSVERLITEEREALSRAIRG